MNFENFVLKDKFPKCTKRGGTNCSKIYMNSLKRGGPGVDKDMALDLMKHKSIVSSLQYHGHFIIALVVNWIYIIIL